MFLSTNAAFDLYISLGGWRGAGGGCTIWLRCCKIRRHKTPAQHQTDASKSTTRNILFKKKYNNTQTRRLRWESEFAGFKNLCTAPPTVKRGELPLTHTAEELRVNPNDSMQESNEFLWPGWAAITASKTAGEGSLMAPLAEKKGNASA